MGDKNPVLHKNLVLPAGSFRRLDGSIGQGGRVEKRREHGWAYAGRDEESRLLMTVVDTSVVMTQRRDLLTNIITDEVCEKFSSYLSD
jgi:hypothetical protein